MYSLADRNTSSIMTSCHVTGDPHLDFGGQGEPADCRQPVEEERGGHVGGGGPGAVAQPGGLAQLLEEQAEEVVQPGAMVGLTERPAEGRRRGEEYGKGERMGGRWKRREER